MEDCYCRAGDVEGGDPQADGGHREGREVRGGGVGGQGLSQGPGPETRGQGLRPGARAWDLGSWAKA